MVARFSMNGTFIEPFMWGLKLGGLMNQSTHNEATFKQGRHHVMTALNQMSQWNLALEQASRCLQAANLSYSFKAIHLAQYVVPASVAYLSSCQIRVLHIGKAANFVQDQLGRLSFITLTIATIALLTFGQIVVATTTLLYLSVGILDRSNYFSPSTQRIIHKANFIIGNVAGLYFGGNFIRLICALDLMAEVTKTYVKSEQSIVKPFEKLAKEIPTTISLTELNQLTNLSDCPLKESHIHREIFPSIRDDIKVDDILKISKGIHWEDHQHVIEARLKKDKRWLEIGQFQFKSSDSFYDSLKSGKQSKQMIVSPLDYFHRNLRSLVESIRDRNISHGRPVNYDMLEKYCRYIVQALENQDEMTQADALIALGVEGGEYCGSGKFQIVEEVYGSLVSQATELPLELRVLACLQQERMRVWQNIYSVIWKLTPFFQAIGYLTDTHAVHNANLFINLTQAGTKFGIPSQTAQNDQTAIINPINHYMATKTAKVIEETFWNGAKIQQSYIKVQRTQGTEKWKIWKWFHIKKKVADIKPYNEQAILTRLNAVIGTAQIPLMDIYSWWLEWIERQDDLSDDEKNDFINELSTGYLNGEPIELNKTINPKFLKAMLIEMGVLDKPDDLLSDEDDGMLID